MAWKQPLLAAAVAATLHAQTATLVIRNARIWTGDPKNPWADSLTATEDMITRVGNVPADAPVAPGARIVDAKGRLVTPGFIDSHTHLIEAGLRMKSVKLRDAKTKKDFVDRIARFAAGRPEGAWIAGGDWDHENWGGELPTRQWIDAVTPKNPVWIQRLDGHMGLANSLALRAAKVVRETPAAPGGTIVRDAKGEPTGVFKDNAMAIVEKAKPGAAAGEVREAAANATKELLRNGVTSAHHMGSNNSDLSVFEAVRADGQLGVRVFVAAPLEQWKPVDKLTFDGYGDRWIRWGTFKAFLDGSLGSHTAAFDEPYTDSPKDSGFFVSSPNTIFDQAFTVDARGMFVAVHAIGDRANRVLLSVFEKILQTSNQKAHRFRIEHAQHLHAADIPRMAKANVIASMQPYHLIDDGRWAEKAIGAERAKTSWAFRSMIDAGVTLAFGSDWFVAPPSVMEGIYAAVTRRTLDGKHPGGWVPEQKITVEEALRAYTAGGAYAAVEEAYKGVLAPGKLADLAMLSEDIFKIDPARIKDVQVDMTIVGGAVAFERR